MKKCGVQIAFVIGVLVLWEVTYRLGVFPELMFPSLVTIAKSFVNGFAKEQLFSMVLYSLSLILKGLVTGILLAFLLSSLAITD